MIFTKLFKEISQEDVAIAGGKGASLGEMTQAGIPIPSGFVVLFAAFENFIEGTPGRHGCLKSDIDAILHHVDHQKIHTIEEASEKIQGIILSSEIPKQIAEEIINSFSQLKSEFVAVRSSATAEDSSSAAWAGQLDTFLNTNKQNLLENVKKCWASLFTPRAIFYRFEKGLHGQKISVAVVVQKMVQSEVAGIAFSVHPVTQDKNQLIIEAGFGLGEAVVSGQITPDSYVVEKKDWFILDIHVAEQEKGLYKKPPSGNEWIELKEGGKQKLTGQQIIELSKLIVNIEKHYGFPCDIEWALEKGTFYITQSRPITTLEKSAVQFEKEILDSFEEVKEYLHLNNVDIQSPPGALCLADLIFTSYTNADKLYSIKYSPQFGFFKENHLWECTPEKKLNALAQKIYSDYITDKNSFSLLMKKEKSLFKEIENFWEKISKISAHNLSSSARNKKVISKHTQKSNLTFDLGVLDNQTENSKLLINFLKKCQEWWLYGIIGEDKGKIAQENLVSQLTKHFNLEKSKAEEIIGVLAHPEDLSEINRSRLNFLELCIDFGNKKKVDKKLKAGIGSYVKDFFYQKTTFYDRIIVTPELVIKEIKEEIKSRSLDMLTKERQKMLNNKKEIDKQKKRYNSLKLDANEKNSLSYLKLMTEWIDKRKTRTMKQFYFVTSILHIVSGQFNVQYDDLTQYQFNELVELIGSGKQINHNEINKRRKGVMIVYQKETSINKLFYGKEAEILFQNAKKIPAFTELSGVVACNCGKNNIKGKVRIVKNPQGITLEQDEIMVTSMTRTEFIPLMKSSLAIITDEGGIACHAAIVARELKKPCIIGTKHATQVLKDGDLITINLNKGTVKLIKKRNL